MRRAARFVGLALFAASAVAVPAGAQSVTVGNEASTVANCFPFGCPAFAGLSRYQQVYSAAAFSGVSGPILIDAITFFNLFNPGTGQFANATYSIFLSTTSRAVAGLSTNLGSNVGADNAVFATVTTHGQGTGAEVTFTGSPFTYDWQTGNLLMDIFITNVGADAGQFAFFQSDNTGTETSRAYVTNGTSVTSVSGLVTEFSYSATPEPASLALMATGLAGLGAWKRRRKRSDV